jgi:hypothetical protein
MDQGVDHKLVDMLTRVNEGHGSTGRHKGLELLDRAAGPDLTRQMRACPESQGNAGIVN